MIAKLSVDLVIEVNRILCADTGENSAVLDRGNLEATLERPWSGFGDFEAYPTLFEKAAVLLHGIAAKQVFENGNKRTAWAVAIMFLELNGVSFDSVVKVEADIFVRAAALDRSLTITDLAEWFESAHKRARCGCATDPRLEYLFLAQSAAHSDDGTTHVLGARLATLAVETLPVFVQLTAMTRIHWEESDMGRQHRLTVFSTDLSIEQEGESTPQGGSTRIDFPVRGGHRHQDGGRMPSIVTVPLALFVVEEGDVAFQVELDGLPVGSLPLKVVVTG